MQEKPNIKIIATHNGSFHADDVFAVATLKLLYPHAKVIRSRDPIELASADLRLDVGLKYDPKTLDFDHHQVEGSGERENGIPYASTGLVWKHFGRFLTDNDDAFFKIDEKIMQALDAVDNGMSTYTVDTAFPYTISTVVKAFNPNWQDENPDFDKAFMEVVDVAMKILRREINSANGASKAKVLVRNAIEVSKKEHPQYVILETFCPWKKLVTEESDALYVLYPNVAKRWSVQAVNLENGSFESRKMLPESWAGADAAKLSELTGVEDAIFCHRKRFICAAESKEGALKLLDLALKE